MRYLTTFSLILLTALLWHPRASAQYWQGGVPSGSYVQTCRNIRTVGNTLEAVCDTGSGSWNWTALRRVDECTSGIENVYGHLQCTKAERYYGQQGYRQSYSQYGLPGGSYMETCSDVHTIGSTLVADCQRRDGSWRRSSLRYFNECSSSIENVNGWLVCSR
jgi:hypothetical protein